jgi:hypothetical protein
MKEQQETASADRKSFYKADDRATTQSPKESIDNLSKRCCIKAF